MNEILMAAAGLLLLLVGASIGYLLGRKGRSDATSKLEETQTAFADYRKDVTRHFDRTAEQFQSIGQQYRDLYEHMAKGAEAFCVPMEPGSALPFSSQTRLPTDSEEGDIVAAGPTELDAEAESEMPLDETPDVAGESEATAEMPAEANIDGSAEDDVIVAEAETADSDADTAEATSDSESVEGTPDKPADDADRIYH